MQAVCWCKKHFASTSRPSRLHCTLMISNHNDLQLKYWGLPGIWKQQCLPGEFEHSSVYLVTLKTAVFTWWIWKQQCLPGEFENSSVYLVNLKTAVFTWRLWKQQCLPGEFEHSSVYLATLKTAVFTWWLWKQQCLPGDFENSSVYLVNLKTAVFTWWIWKQQCLPGDLRKASKRSRSDSGRRSRPAPAEPLRGPPRTSWSRTAPGPDTLHRTARHASPVRSLTRRPQATDGCPTEWKGRQVDVKHIGVARRGQGAMPIVHS